MRLPFIIASIICSLVFSSSAPAAGNADEKFGSSKKKGLEIRVEGGGWGNASREEIEAVLYAVADELLSRIPKKLAVPIVVTHTERNPIALYQKGPNGEYQVRLHATNRRWPLFAYEFAHELCHIMSNYEEHAGADTTKYNQWFEETLCETASLYTVRTMAANWETSPPNPDFAQQAPAMRRFANRLINEGHRSLPADTALADWLRGNEDSMRRDPYLRDKNEVVANLLLPLFEQDPEKWDTLGYLNMDPADARNSLEAYLHNWYDHAPTAHREFIEDLLALLGVKNMDLTTTAEATATPRHPRTTGRLTGQTGPVLKQ